MKRCVIIPFDLGELGERELEIWGDYTPGSKPVMYFRDGTGHPGDPPEFFIDEIFLYPEMVKLPISLFPDQDLLYDRIFEKLSSEED